jgi:hypothetical protein
MKAVCKPTIAPGVLLPCLTLVLGACVSPRYKLARDDTPPPVLINLATTQPPVVMVLKTVIIYQGPGSWKREAFWDEYVVTVHNHGEQPLTIASATLTDFAGATYSPGGDPWVLERESKSLERKYRDAGVAFVRNAGPGVLIVGAGVGGIAIGGGLFSAGAGAVAVTAVVALPVYYITVAVINHSNKAAVVAEFNRRRLVLPLNVAPGETRTGSFFFPMVPNPRSLSLRWSSGESGGDAVRSLEALHGLHIEAPPPPAAKK